ncbi:uncharacterized protein DUF4402 [Jejuia pallidilutea]|uniref:Uncharacterized protein DUF4402 n=1 Tax=Jejuia pallidilutea TaxID=504487 RepID=A0A362X1Y7_9FLAO|nr:DUF4402 domain-containing protein [Jejuia pallidilutea]PQV49475.1 uncharacterized protein DUF4402 [Jejuia pallidilutea]
MFLLNTEIKQLYALAIIAMFFKSAAIYGQTGTSAGKAEILRRVTVYKNDDLRFGAFTPDAQNPSTVMIVPRSSGNASFIDDYSTNLISHNHLPRTAAKFTVQGASGTQFMVTYPTSIQLTTVGDSSNTEEMTAFDFTTTLEDDSSRLQGAPVVFYLGGSLTINGNQALGAYSGLVSVTVAYF